MEDSGRPAVNTVRTLEWSVQVFRSE
ncbi:unnamed protein product [Ophioblennius macclurei]